MENKDFKYILQDITHIYIGRELSYAELWDMEETPFKLKAIMNNYFVKDAPRETKLLEHICHMSKEEFSYEVYTQLKLHIKVNYQTKKKDLFSKSFKYETVNCSLGEFLEKYKDLVLAKEAFVEELSISKLALLAIGI